MFIGSENGAFWFGFLVRHGSVLGSGMCSVRVCGSGVGVGLSSVRVFGSGLGSGVVQTCDFWFVYF